MSHDPNADPRDSLSRQLEARDRELAHLRSELEAFTYSIAHDLRAPLRGISGYLEALREDHGRSLPAPAASFLGNALDCATRMHAMMDELLQISRLGRRELMLRPVPLGPLVEKVRQEVVADAPAREIVWKLGDLPIVECDPSLVREVWAALISNAVKFTRRSPRAVIEIEAHARNQTPTLVVRDNGVGFDLQRAGNLFAPFFRLHNPQDFEGTGTGLAKAARIVRRHGGRIWAEATEEQGAAFYFTLGP
jgi:light-regulated signal transduction histidine kinase (bacteriophytochrome)